MKKLNLFLSSFSQNILSSIILIIILSVSLGSIQDVIGQYRYITYSRYIIENEYLENSDYFMIDLESLPVIPDEQLEYTKSIREDIEKLDGVNGIAYSQNGTAEYRSSTVNFELYNEYMEKAFSKQLTEGTWFDQSDSSSDIPNVIVTGSIFNDIPVGSDIEITLFGNSENPTQTTLTVHIIGKIGYPWYSADYSTISNKVSTKDFLIQANNIIFDDTEQVYELLNKNSYIQSLSYSYFVMYDDDCTEEQKNAVREHFETIGSYATYEQVLENTNENIRTELMQNLVTPIFLLIIATIALISISTLNTYKKLKDHSVYYLCGCSRKKSFSYLFAEISLVAIISTVINIIYVSIIISQLTNGTAEYTNCIVDYRNIIFAIVYCIITITITTILPFIVYKKNTPLEIYRRNHND